MKRLLSVVGIGCWSIGAAWGQSPIGQTGGDYMTDPETGIVYRKVTRTVETPVTSTQMQQRTQTVYTPKTVTETRPTTRTVYTPIIENRWEPRVHGRWNPFVAPTVAYHAVPQTHWTSRQETVQQTETKTQWVAEKRTIEVPTQTVSVQRKQEVNYEAVGRVADPAAAVQNAIAARLRPLRSDERIEPTAIASAPVVTGRSYVAPRIAASTVGRMTSDPPRRTLSQGGLRAKELIPAGGGVRGSILR